MTTTGAAVADTPRARLEARLDDPATVESLNRLLDRVDVVAFAIDAVDGLLRRSDTVIESISSGVHEVTDSAAFGDAASVAGALPSLVKGGSQIAQVASGPAFDNVLRSGLIERLGDPNTLKLLGTLLDRLEVAVFALEAVDGFLRRGDEIAESAADAVAELRRGVPDGALDGLQGIAGKLPQLVDSVGKLTDSGALDHLPALLDSLAGLTRSGMLDGKVVEVLGEVGHHMAGAYRDAAASKPAPIGLGGLLKALGDPEVKRVLGFAVAVARSYSRHLK